MVYACDDACCGFDKAFFSPFQRSSSDLCQSLFFSWSVDSFYSIFKNLLQFDSSVLLISGHQIGNAKLVDESGQGATNIWANDGHPEVVVVGREHIATVDHGGENAWAKITGWVQGETAIVTKRHADGANGETDENGNDGWVDLILGIGNGQNGEDEHGGSDNLIEAVFWVIDRNKCKV
jgi:hypothetical protein